MLKRFLPQQGDFFRLFQKTADILVDSTTQFHSMLHNLQNQQEYVDAISKNEDEADKLAHTSFMLLHKTFITPFDRHDIHYLTSHLDDILDLINRCAQRFPYYELKKVPDEMIELAEISMQASLLLKQAIYRLHSLKKSQEIFSFCEQIDALESKAHQIVLAGERVLFKEEKDFKQFFKLKEIYSQTKLVINRCQDVGNIIKGIILEYS
jgi:predicted phosphate transport protein (TIGR00153 family)